MKAISPQTPDRPTTESAVAEVRRIKIELAQQFGYDLKEMLRDARSRQGRSGHLVVDRSNTV